MHQPINTDLNAFVATQFATAQVMSFASRHSTRRLPIQPPQNAPVQRWKVEAEDRDAGRDHPEAENRQEAETTADHQRHTGQGPNPEWQSFAGLQRAPRGRTQEGHDTPTQRRHPARLVAVAGHALRSVCHASRNASRWSGAAMRMRAAARSASEPPHSRATPCSVIT